MARRRRAVGFRPSNRNAGAKVVTLVMMIGLLLGIIFVGAEFSERLSWLFASPPVEEEPTSELPSTLDGGPGSDRVTNPHTGALIRRATREAAIISRRAIGQNVDALTGTNPSEDGRE